MDTCTCDNVVEFFSSDCTARLGVTTAKNCAKFSVGILSLNEVSEIIQTLTVNSCIDFRNKFQFLRFNKYCVCECVCVCARARACVCMCVCVCVFSLIPLAFGVFFFAPVWSCEQNNTRARVLKQCTW